MFKYDYRIIHYQFFRLKSIETFFYIFLKLLGVKLVYTAHEVLPVEKSNKEIYFDKLIYKFSDALIVHSKRNMNDLSVNYKIALEKIYVTPHGSFDFYEGNSRINIESARKELGIDNSKKVMLFLELLKNTRA